MSFTRSILSRALLLSAGVLWAGCSFAAPNAGTPHKGHFQPMLKRGPAAFRSSATSNLTIFSCQDAANPLSYSCYSPAQMQHAYGIDSLIAGGFDGSGKTIVIIDAFQSPKIESQLQTFNSMFNLPQLNNGGATFTQIAPQGLTKFNRKDQNMQGWAGEISLDVEWAHAIAPGANIVLVLAKSDSDQDILDATAYAIHNRLGDVISQSFGEAESCVDPTIARNQHQLFAEATLAGIALFASAGDDGAAQPTCDGSGLLLSASSPATDLLVTAVGGTTLLASGYCLDSSRCSIDIAPGTYGSESVWNEPQYNAGGGGGFSIVFSKPIFQLFAVPGNKPRGIPDVSYNAAIDHGVLTYFDIPGEQASYYLVGGTSSGSPQWAALAAIASQKAGYSLGFLNAAFYRIALNSGSYSASFHDITIGDNSNGSIQGFNATRGWDAATGLGSPIAPALIDLLVRSVSPADGLFAITTSDLDQLRSRVRGHAGTRHRPH